MSNGLFSSIAVLALSWTAAPDFRAEAQRAMQAADWPGLKELSNAELQRVPDSADGHLFCGIALANLSQPKEALVHFKRAGSLAPSRTATWFNAGLTATDLGDRAELLSALDQLTTAEAVGVKAETASRILPLTALELTRNPAASALLLGEPPAAVEFRQVTIKLQPSPPRYPLDAKKNRIQGTVVVQVTVDPSGIPIAARATAGPRELHQTSEVYALWWRFAAPKNLAPGRSFRFDLTMPFRLR